MKKYIVQGINGLDNIQTSSFYTETEELRDQLNTLENNIKFHDVYIKQAISKADKLGERVDDYETIMHDELERFENKIDKYERKIDWILMPWWKRLFKSKRKFLNI